MIDPFRWDPFLRQEPILHQALERPHAPRACLGTAYIFPWGIIPHITLRRVSLVRFREQLECATLAIDVRLILGHGPRAAVGRNAEDNPAPADSAPSGHSRYGGAGSRCFGSAGVVER
jgi:hypothetical protein